MFHMQFVIDTYLFKHSCSAEALPITKNERKQKKWREQKLESYTTNQMFQLKENSAEKSVVNHYSGNDKTTRSACLYKIVSIET